MILHEMRDVDPREIAEIHVRAWRESYPGIIPQDVLDDMKVSDREDLWRRVSALPEHWGRVCELGGQKVGFISGVKARQKIEHHAFEIAAIYILKEFHGQGIGRLMVKDFLERVGTQDVYAWVLEKNPSLAFYERLGCEVVGEMHVEIGGVTFRELAYSFQKVELEKP